MNGCTGLPTSTMRPRDDRSPRAGMRAPVFTLAGVTDDGSIGARVDIGTVGPRPVGVVFGSVTCPALRIAAPAIHRAAPRLDGAVDFRWVYLREAHPADEQHLPHNHADGMRRRVQHSLTERARVARESAAALGLTLPLAVDDLDDRVGAAYRAAPSRLYVIGTDGRVVFLSGPGPSPIDVDEWATALAAQAGGIAGRSGVTP